MNSLATQVPSIETEHYALSRFTEQDAADVLSYAGHPQVAKTVAWEAHRSETESLDYIRRLLERTSFSDGRLFLPWAVREKASSPVIGSVTFTELGANRGQVGFVFHFDYWHRHIAAESVRGVIEWIFLNAPRFDRIQGRCFPTNVVSNQILEAAALRFEGINRAMLRVRGEPRDISLYAITRTDWERMGQEGSYVTVPVSSPGHI